MVEVGMWNRTWNKYERKSEIKNDWLKSKLNLMLVHEVENEILKLYIL